MKDIFEDKRARKTIIAVFLLLCFGGFTYSIFQMMSPPPKEGMGSFTSGFSGRGGFFVPLSQYFGLGEEEMPPGPVRYRGMDPALFNKPRADLSGWMARSGPAGGAGGTESSKTSRSFDAPVSAPGTATKVPRMSGALAGGVGGSKASGGASQTTAAISKFSGGAGGGNVKISGPTDAGETAGGRNGALAALSGARSLLNAGLRSGSAMSARSKWGQAFGLSQRGTSESMAYSGPGMVRLDTIKSGEIDSLKTGSGFNSLSPSPVKDPASEAKSISLKKMAGEEGADEANSAMKEALSSMGGGGKGGGESGGEGGNKGDVNPQRQTDPNTGKPVELPPPEVVDVATTPPPKGTFCPDGCGEGSKFYKDSKVMYAKGADGRWTAVYEGQDAKGQSYMDKVAIEPGKEPPTEPLTSAAKVNGVWQETKPGTSDPVEPQ